MYDCRCQYRQSLNIARVLLLNRRGINLAALFYIFIITLKHLIRIRARLSDQRLTDIIGAVDVVLLPYLCGSNSGFSMLVLSCGQRLLCSALPMFRDLANRPGPPWVYVFDHRTKDLSAELEAALSRFQHDVVDTDAKSRLQTFLDDCSFDRGARQLRQLYERLIN